MNILMIASYLPYPLHSGGQVRLYNLIKELSVKNDITLICEKRLHQTADDVKQLEKICKTVITVPRHKQWSLKHVARSAASAHSFLVIGHTNKEMHKKIKEQLALAKFDLIHVETFYVMQNIPPTSLPIVLVDHNIEYKVYQRFVKRASFVLRPLLSVDVAKIKREELEFWKEASRVVAVSEDDKKIMEKNGVRPTVVANGVNIDLFAFKPKSFGKLRVKKVLFIGDFKWIQNQDTAKFIIEEIWPTVTANTDAKMWFVARHIPENIKNLTHDPTIIFDAESSELSAQEIFQDADVLLSPIRVGGGTSYKILEAMSCGTPVVTMPLSANAIQATDGENIMTGRTAYELAEKTMTILEQEKIYKKISQNGRKLIEENYSWKKIAKDLEAVYEGVVS